MKQKKARKRPLDWVIWGSLVTFDKTFKSNVETDQFKKQIRIEDST